MSGYWFHSRLADGHAPAGITVSKRAALPTGDFEIIEYVWPLATLWFVKSDEFTEDERQEAYVEFCGIAQAMETKA